MPSLLQVGVANQVVSFAVPLGTTVGSYAISKNGGPGYTGSGSITNITGGYNSACQIALTSFDVNTVGPLALQVIDSTSTVQVAVIDLNVVTAFPGDPGELTNAERDAVAAAILGYANGVDIGVTPAHALCAMVAILAGLTLTTGPVTSFKNWAGTKDRVTITTSPTGRITVVFDFS